ncbi:MAG: DUF3352 domain-containing protein [Solirubrobacteraceae bacterium]
MTISTTSRARRALLGAALALSLPLAACGGSDSVGDNGPDPASAVPAKAPVYLEATVRPEGDLKDNTLQVAGKLLNSENPEEELKKFLQDAGTETDTGNFNYDEDLEPWLGQRVGLYFTELREGNDAQGALVLQVTDADKAKESLSKAAREPEKGEPAPSVSEKQHNGTSYEVTTDDTAQTVVDDLALVGTEAGVKASLDALKSDGGALADADAFKKTSDALGEEDESIGSLYVDVKSTIDQAVASGEVEKDQATALRQVLGASGFDTVAAGLSVEENALRVDIASPASKDIPNLGNPSEAVAALPGDSWLALGIGDIQKVVEYQLTQLSNVTALGGQADVNTLIEQLNRQLKINIREDLLAWMGEGAVFVRGTNLADIGGAIVVQSKDAAKTKASMETIERLVKLFGGKNVTVSPLTASGVEAGFVVRTEQFPLPVNVALAGDKFIVAVTDPALQAAIKPAGTLGDNADFKAAADALGDGIKPSVYLGFRPVLDLVEGFGVGEDPDYKKAKPTLDQLRALAAGGNSDDDVSRQRLVLTLTD